MTRQPIVTCFHRHLVCAEVSASRQRRTLPGFEVEAVFPGDTVELSTHCARFVEHRQFHAKLFQPFFAATDTLENQSARRAATNRFDLGGDVRQYAALSWDVEFVDHAVNGVQHAA
ncbi:Uncharacterised protein [Shigella sonnei]|nr:Uncharacterised protein [Shigella sonnei]